MGPLKVHCGPQVATILNLATQSRQTARATAGNNVYRRLETNSWSAQHLASTVPDRQSNATLPPSQTAHRSTHPITYTPITKGKHPRLARSARGRCPTKVTNSPHVANDAAKHAAGWRSGPYLGDRGDGGHDYCDGDSQVLAVVGQGQGVVACRGGDGAPATGLRVHQQQGVQSTTLLKTVEGGFATMACSFVHDSS
jgi:hypothetical protein